MSTTEHQDPVPPSAANDHHLDPGGQEKPPERVSWAVLALALVAQVLVVLDISVVNTALPTIGADLQLSSGDLQWVVTAYLLMSGGGLLLGGRIADLLSRRRVLITGLAVFTTASLVSGFASTAGVLVGARAAQGLGAALMTPAALAIIMTTYAGAQRAKGLAMWGAVGGLGIAAGVLVGGVITTFAGWQMIFWVNVPIGVGAIVAALVLLGKNGPARPGLGQLDLPGAIAAVTGLAALVFGIQSAASDGWTSPKTLGVLIVSGLLLVAFGFIERRVAHPLVPPHTWRIKTLVSGTGVMLGVTGLLVGAVFLSSVFFQTVLGYTALQAGLAFLPHGGGLDRWNAAREPSAGPRPAPVGRRRWVAAGRRWCVLVVDRTRRRPIRRGSVAGLAAARCGRRSGLRGRVGHRDGGHPGPACRDGVRVPDDRA